MSGLTKDVLDYFHKNLSTYSPISYDDICLIIPIVKIEHYKPGEYFIKPGDSAQKVGFILSGLTKTYFLSEEGEEIISGFGNENTISGLYYDILTMDTSSGFIQAIEETTILTTNYKLLIDITKNNISWLKLLLAISQNLYCYLSTIQKNIDLKNATERYSFFQKEYPSLVNRLPQNQIAKHLRIDGATLSRIKNKSGIYSIK